MPPNRTNPASTNHPPRTADHESNMSMVDGRAVDGHLVDGQFPDRHIADGQLVDGDGMNRDHIDGEPMDDGHTDGHIVDGHHADDHPMDDHQMDGDTADGHLVDGHAIDGHAVDGRAVDGQAIDGQAGDGHHMDGQAIDGHSADGHRVDGHVRGRPSLEGPRLPTIPEVDGDSDNAFPPPFISPSMTEKERLDAVHMMHISLLNPRHDHLINAHLAKVHASGRRSQVLDVGTLIEASCLISSLPPSITPPPPLQPFSFMLPSSTEALTSRAPAPGPYHLHASTRTQTSWASNVTQPLPWPKNTFDLIHVKSMLMDIPSYPLLVGRLTETLRPGGLMILVESELFYECLQGPPSELLASWSASLRKALTAKSTDVDLPSKLDSTLAATAAYSPQFYFQEVGCPVGEYMQGESKALQVAGRIQAAVLRASLFRLVSACLDPGPERSQLESLIDKCTEVLCSPSSRYLQRLFAVYAYKKIPNERWHRHSNAF